MIHPALSAGLAAALIATGAQAADYSIASIDGTAAAPGAQISFLPEGGVSATSGCNTFNATAAPDAGDLVIVGPVAATRMACVGEALSAQDDALGQLLSSRISVALDLVGGRVILGNGDHEAVLTIAAPQD